MGGGSPGKYAPDIAFCWAVEPSAVSPFLPPQPAVPVGPEIAAGDAPRRLSSLPQAVRDPPQRASASATTVSALPCLSSLTDLAFLTCSGRMWTPPAATSHVRLPSAAKICADTARSDVWVARTRLTIRVDAARTRGQSAAGTTAYAVSTLWTVNPKRW